MCEIPSNVILAEQFAARFECRVDAATAQVCRATPLDDLPAERIAATLARTSARCTW